MRHWLILVILVVLPALPAVGHPGIGVVVDSRGNVYYTDLKQVWRVDARGAKTIAVPNVHTHELYLDAHDNLYGEHLWYSGPQDGSGKWFYRVWKREPDGKIVEIVPATEGFRRDYSFVRDAAGDMYVARFEGDRATRVHKVDAGGQAQLLAGGAPGGRDGRGAQAGFADIRWMAYGADGNLYVTDDHDVRRVTPDGTVTALARKVGEHSATAMNVSSRHDLMGLCADAQGNVYVANYGARKVKKIGRDGKITDFTRSTFPWSATGVALAGNKVYVLEYADPFAVRVRAIPLTPH